MKTCAGMDLCPRDLLAFALTLGDKDASIRA